MKLKSFYWDEHNLYKNEEKHGVHYTECEQVFFNKPLIIIEDPKHSRKEARYKASGITDANRYLVIIFTIRDQKVRVISARDQSRKERNEYNKYK